MGWASLVYAVATMALAYPALTGQFLVNPRSDQYIAGFGFRNFAVESLRSGHGIPQWNPYLFGGMPYVAAMHGDIFYPTQLLRLLLGTDVGMTWGFVIHLFLAGLFTFGFLRAWGLAFYPALVGGLAYMLGGPIASYASPGHDGKLFVSALLPLTLWMLIRGIRDARPWAWGALALVVGLGVLAPHPQLIQYLLLTSGAFALFLALGTDANGVKMDRRTGVRRLALALAAVVLGMAMGAVQFAPVREYVAWSPRAGGRGYEYATTYSFPLIELFNIYVPQFTGILERYWGPNGIHLHSEYIGGAVLLLASAAFGGLGSALGGDTRRGFRRFWLATGIVALLWMLGSSTPFFHLIYELVPGTKFFRAPSTIIYVFSFALSVLAALGTERVLARAVSRKLVLGWVAFGAFVAVLATVGGLSSIASDAARGIGAHLGELQGFDPSAAASQWEERANANRSELLLGAWRSLVFLLLAAGAVLAFLRNAIAARALGVALALVVALDLWSVERHYWLFSPPARVLYASDPAIELLKRQPEPGRVLVKQLAAEGVAPRDPYFGGDGSGTGTGLMVHGIRAVRGYHGNELGRYDHLQDAVVGGNVRAMDTPAFWAHENTRYLYTNAAVSDTQFKLLIGPVKNSAGSTVYLYRLPGDNPFAWVTPASTKAPDADVLNAVLDPRFDPRRIAVFNDSVPLHLPAPTALPAPLPISAATSAYSPGHATITLSGPAPAASALVVSENYFPGWTAKVDGRAQPLFRADYNLIGVPLAAGARTIELSFQDPAYGPGKGITIVAALAALLALGVGVVLDRRVRG